MTPEDGGNKTLWKEKEEEEEEEEAEEEEDGGPTSEFHRECE